MQKSQVQLPIFGLAGLVNLVNEKNPNWVLFLYSYSE